jgi:hypothetical protein
MRLEKLVGAGLGVAMLFVIFLAPFSSAISVIAGSQETLYIIFHFFLDNFGSVSHLHSSSLELIAYFYFFGTILLLVAGILGSFPLVSGGLGLSGILILTASGLFSPQYTPSSVVYGFGYYLLWGLLVIQIVQLVVARRSKIQL